jgi:hypothetical protein
LPGDISWQISCRPGAKGVLSDPQPSRRGVARLSLEGPRQQGLSMSADDQITYLEYKIRLGQDGTRFIAYVSRDGALIEHDGRASEMWASASCVNRDRAIHVAKTAIDTDRIR